MKEDIIKTTEEYRKMIDKTVSAINPLNTFSPVYYKNIREQYKKFIKYNISEDRLDLLIEKLKKKLLEKYLLKNKSQNQ